MATRRRFRPPSSPCTEDAAPYVEEGAGPLRWKQTKQESAISMVSLALCREQHALLRTRWRAPVSQVSSFSFSRNDPASVRCLSSKLKKASAPSSTAAAT